MSITIRKIPLVSIGLLFLFGCSTNPNVRKQKYLKSGQTYFDKGNYRSAEIEFRNATAIDPRYEEGHYQLAQTYLKLGELSAAKRELDVTVGLNPRNFQAQLQLTGMLLA